MFIDFLWRRGKGCLYKMNRDIRVSRWTEIFVFPVSDVFESYVLSLVRTLVQVSSVIVEHLSVCFSVRGYINQDVTPSISITLTIDWSELSSFDFCNYINVSNLFINNLCKHGSWSHLRPLCCYFYDYKDWSFSIIRCLLLDEILLVTLFSYIIMFDFPVCG